VLIQKNGKGEKMKTLLTIILLISFFSSKAFSQDAGKGADLYKKCVLCHGDNGEGKRSQKAPKIAGQFDWYLYKQLKDIKSMTRKNDAMIPYVKGLSDTDLKDLSAFISKMK
jgi:cytochrome c553